MAPGDPRCPHCDGPISATSSYCMHCGEDVESPVGVEADDNADASDVEEFDQVTAYEPPPGTGDGGWLDPAGPLAVPSSPRSLARRALTVFGPGLLDDVSTVAVAGVAGLVVGVVGFVVVLLVARSLVALLVGPLAAIAAGLWVVNNRSVFGALRKGCYAVATALALVPTIALGPSMTGGTFAGQIILFAIAAVAFGVPALLLAGVGHAAGKCRPESARE